MLDNFAIAASSICVLIGSVLLYVGFSQPDSNQNLTMLTGAALVSLGLITLGGALKNKWTWKKNYKKWRQG